jgi:hypothetical protein
MTAPHGHPLDGLLEDALPDALRLVDATRLRDPAAAAHVLGPLLADAQRISALAVVLACLVPDDTPAADLLAWTHGPVVDEATYAQIVELHPEPGRPGRPAEERPAGYRRCCRCGKRLPLTLFRKDRTQKGGFRPSCKDCERTPRKQAAS